MTQQLRSTRQLLSAQLESGSSILETLHTSSKRIKDSHQQLGAAGRSAKTGTQLLNKMHVRFPKRGELAAVSRVSSSLPKLSIPAPESHRQALHLRRPADFCAHLSLYPICPYRGTICMNLQPRIRKGAFGPLDRGRGEFVGRKQDKTSTQCPGMPCGGCRACPVQLSLAFPCSSPWSQNFSPQIPPP